jgi:hypothetical protein
VFSAITLIKEVTLDNRYLSPAGQQRAYGVPRRRLLTSSLLAGEKAAWCRQPPVFCSA